MAVGGAAGGLAGEGEGDDVFAEQAGEPEDGADEALVAAGNPAHVLGPVEGGDLFGEFGGEDFGGGAALLERGCREVVALGRGDGLEVGDGDAGFAGEGFGGGGGEAVLEGDLYGGAGGLFGDVGLLREDAMDEDGEAARGGVACAVGSAEINCSRVSRARVRLRSSAWAEGSMRAGTSSSPISSKKSGIWFLWCSVRNLRHEAGAKARGYLGFHSAG